MYRVVVETPDGNLSQGMRRLDGMCTQASNRRHPRTGHLFQGRFKAILVDKDGYLLELARHVVLNPVRARTVKHPGKYPWRSYRAMVGGSTGSPVARNRWVARAIWQATYRSATTIPPVRARGNRPGQHLGRTTPADLSRRRASRRADAKKSQAKRRQTEHPACSAQGPGSIACGDCAKTPQPRRCDQRSLCHRCLQLPRNRRPLQIAPCDHRPDRSSEDATRRELTPVRAVRVRIVSDPLS